jgi:3-isopropylmalate/(R)-2-methylmalate dehydratase small subunit
MLELSGRPTLKGRAILLPSDVRAGLIVPISSRGSYNRQAFKEHCFEYLDPMIRARIASGDIIVTGKNFARGESGEETAMALMGLGIGAVVAESANRIFLRNAINLGFPVVILPNATSMIDDFDVLIVDPFEAIVRNMTKGLAAKGKVLPKAFIRILEAGDIVSDVKHYFSKLNVSKAGKSV